MNYDLHLGTDPDDLVLAVEPHEIHEQRRRGWVDFHPETFCHRCGARNVRSWSVDSDRWNAACAALGVGTGTVLCPGCFDAGHILATGLTCGWHLTVATPFRPLVS